MPNRIEVREGKQYGSWTVVAEVDKCNNRRTFRVRCVCGNESAVAFGDLRQGKSTRCRGCQIASRNLRHGGAIRGHKLPEYEVWKGIVKRCHNPNSKAFVNYGGRGIEVCARWRGDTGFANFYADMGSRPSPKHTIERTDNDAGYSLSNCRWATRTEQARNTRRNRLLTISRTTKSLAEWAENGDVSYPTIRARLDRGWDADAAVFEPTHPMGSQAKYPINMLAIGYTLEIQLQGMSPTAISSAAWACGKRYKRKFATEYIGPRGQPTAVRVTRLV